MSDPPAAPSGPDDRYRLPGTGPLDLIRQFGPGMILMMTGIGTSHLVTAPAAGGRFEFALLWCIPIAYVFKYYGFEMAFRFTYATGRSMLDAYATAPGKWPLWYVLVTTLVQCALGQAGRLIAASAVLYYYFSERLGLGLPIWVYALGLGLVSVALLLRGHYRALETAAKIAAGFLLASSAAVYLVEPAPLAAMGRFFIFEMPEGSWLVVAAFLGLLPTGIDVSLQASEWGRAKRIGTGRVRADLVAEGAVQRFDPFRSSSRELGINVGTLKPEALAYCHRWFQIGLWDFRIGHVLSFLVACLFLLLAAVWLYPNPVEGTPVMGEIATIFTESVGPWMMVVFLVGSFAATYSTALNYFDGWPRVVAACCRNLFPGTARLSTLHFQELTREIRRTWYSEYNIYRATMLYSLAAATLLIAGLPRPVWLVLMASALAFFVAPVIYLLNLYYCFTVIPKEDETFYPSAPARWFSVISLVAFTGLTAMLIAARVF